MEDKKSIILDIIEAFEKKDFKKIMSFIDDKSVVFDPHFPVQTMSGKKSIERGLKWTFRWTRQPGLKIQNMWMDGSSGVVEIDTNHLLHGGVRLKYKQIFIFDIVDGKIRRLDTYVPYGPGGMRSVLSYATRLVWLAEERLPLLGYPAKLLDKLPDFFGKRVIGKWTSEPSRS